MFKKPFSKKLHTKYDIMARDKVKEILKGTSLEVRDNPNKYKTDLEIYENDVRQCNFEVEVKTSWKGKKFPFDSGVDFLGRKEWQMVKDIRLIMFNEDASRHLEIRGDRLKEFGKPYQKVTVYSDGELEDFIQVPNKYVKFDWLYELAEKKRLKNAI